MKQCFVIIDNNTDALVNHQECITLLLYCTCFWVRFLSIKNAKVFNEILGFKSSIFIFLIIEYTYITSIIRPLLVRMKDYKVGFSNIVVMPSKMTDPPRLANATCGLVRLFFQQCIRCCCCCCYTAILYM